MPEAAQTGGTGYELLHDAFRSFDQAAESLEASYRALTERMDRLDLELAASNEALREQLKENEEIKAHLAAILESLSTGVLVTGLGGVIIRTNQAAERLLGVERTQILGQELRNLLAQLRLDIETYPVVSPVGTPLAVSRTVLKSADGQTAGDMFLLHDVSIVRRLEQQVQRRDRLAGMGQMVGRIAHEIRNPLGSVELFASMLRQDLANDPARRRYAEHISVAVQAMDRLLANLLVYAKPDCSRAEWHRAKPIVQQALTLAAHELVRAQVETAVAVDDDLELWCDAGQLQQALLNLFLNAAQAMPTGGRLSITVAPQPSGDGRSWMRIEVSDTGVGIDTASLSRVFDPFFTTREEGTGLGLAIVHGIVEAHQGQITIDTETGRGTTVTLSLPAGPPPAVGTASGHAALRRDDEEEDA